MVYTLPKLPYAPDALAPVISQETVDYHYGKHEKTYIDNLNKLIDGTDYADMPLEDIIRQTDGPLYNNAAQAWNHIFYFFALTPDGGGEPEGKLRKIIDEQFGNFEAFKKEFEEAATKIFGSGWCWLARDNDGKLFIIQTGNAGNPLTDGLTPVFCIDVWEHAYYLDYQNRRAEYLKKIWDIVDWAVVESRY